MHYIEHCYAGPNERNLTPILTVMLASKSMQDTNRNIYMRIHLFKGPAEKQNTTEEMNTAIIAVHILLSE